MPRTFAAALLVIAILAESTVVVAQESADEPIARAAAKALDEARAIVALSRELAIEERGTNAQGDQTRRLVRRPLPDPINHTDWSPPSLAPVATPGLPIPAGPDEDWPTDIAIDNAGVVLLANSRGVWLHGVAASQATAVCEAPGADLQWDAEGRRLLVASSTRSAIIAWPGGEVAVDLHARGVNGSLLWAPRGESLWKLTDLFDPDASQPVRVLIRVREVPLDAAASPRDLLTEPRRLATIGTLPSLGLAWGHPTTLYQILPDPAPLWTLDDRFEFTPAPLTQPGQSVDLDPEADAAGRVWFVRAARVIDTGAGVAVSPSARAWIREPSGAERPATAEPTYDIAVSPDGTRVAVLVRRAGRGLVVATSAADLLARDLSAHAQARTEFDTAATAVLDDLRRALAALPLAARFNAQPVDYDTPLALAPGDMAALDGALRAALQTHVGLDLAPDTGAFGQLDGFLRAADGLWSEEPATILALAATYGRTLASQDEVTWELDEVPPSLSNDLQDASVSDNLLYTLHTPYLVAREALAGRLHLDATATELLTRWERPIALVENYDAATVARVVARPLVERGIDDQAPLDDLAPPILGVESPSDAALTLLWYRALKEGDAPVALAAAMALARNNPTSTEALLRAARALHAFEFNEPARLLLDRVAELAPDDLEVWIALGEGWFAHGDLDAAERAYLRARALDATGAYAVQIAAELESIAARRP